MFDWIPPKHHRLLIVLLVLYYLIATPAVVLDYVGCWQDGANVLHRLVASRCEPSETVPAQLTPEQMLGIPSDRPDLSPREEEALRNIVYVGVMGLPVLLFYGAWAGTILYGWVRASYRA